MKRILFIFFLSAVTLNAIAQCTFERFYKYYPDNQIVTKTIKTSDGGSLTVTGMYYDTLNPGFGNSQDEDMCVVKMDACGNTLWKTHIGSPSEGDDASDVVETDSGDYLVMGYAAFQQAFGNIRVAKLSKNGQVIWNKLYSGTKQSYPYSITKRTKKNTYVICGNIETNPSKSISNSYLFEINDAGNVLKNVVLPYTTRAVIRTFEINDTTYLMVMQGEDSLFLAETDTSFNIHWIKQLFEDSIIHRVTKFYDACLSYDRQSIAILFHAYLIQPNDDVNDFMARINLTGERITFKTLQDSFPGVSPEMTCIIPTPDNGYIIGPGMLYTDSNFNYIKYQAYRGGLLSLVLNNDGGITGSGGIDVINSDSSIVGELYIIKVDQYGHFAHEGITEGKKALNHLSIYPNPAYNNLHITTNTIHHFQIEMINLTGQTIYTSKFIGETIIDMVPFSQGIYLLRITDNNSGIVKTQKIAVVK